MDLSDRGGEGPQRRLWTPLRTRSSHSGGTRGWCGAEQRWSGAGQQRDKVGVVMGT